MANEEHLALLRKGVAAWNAWRQEKPDIVPNLGWGDLRMGNLGGVNLGMANLTKACLSGTDLSNGYLSGASLYMVDLGNADLAHAYLSGTNLSGANLSGTNLSGARLYRTIFADVDLSAARGLETCQHEGPSVLDYSTLKRSGRLPLAFLRGCGLPDRLIDYLPSLLDEEIRYRSCFITYSMKDKAFASRLYADLMNIGVRCWFAPQDMTISDKFRQESDGAIHVHERLLLILSESSVSSEWVKNAVGIAIEEEQRLKRTILFPVTLDDAVLRSQSGWSADIRRTRCIGDFRGWKDEDAYRKSVSRLARDLTLSAAHEDVEGR